MIVLCRTIRCLSGWRCLSTRWTKCCDIWKLFVPSSTLIRPPSLDSTTHPLCIALHLLVFAPFHPLAWVSHLLPYPTLILIHQWHPARWLVLVSYHLLLTISLSQLSFSYTQRSPEEQPQCRAKLWGCSKVCKWQRIRYELHMWRSHFNVQIFVVASVVVWAAYLLWFVIHMPVLWMPVCWASQAKPICRSIYHCITVWIKSNARQLQD